MKELTRFCLRKRSRVYESLPEFRRNDIEHVPLSVILSLWPPTPQELGDSLLVSIGNSLEILGMIFFIKNIIKQPRLVGAGVAEVKKTPV